MAWHDDGTRYFPDLETRRRFHAACKVELERRGLPFVALEGGREERLAKAVAGVEDAFQL